MVGYLSNIEKLTLENNNFRQVLYTGKFTQLVVMSLLPSEEIGLEVHETTDQFIRVESGEGKLIIAGEEHHLEDGDAFIVPAGTPHNVINTSDQNQLKLYTLYSPPHHKDQVVHKTKAEAESDTEDHL
jgi:mannose-6-phosphate isomerase-like protein (cupin superfamily)